MAKQLTEEGTLSGARVSGGQTGTSSGSPPWHWQYLGD